MKWFEKATFLEIEEGRVWEISETPMLKERIRLWDSLPMNVIRNQLAVQHFFPPRKFLCLSNRGIHQITKLRPVDELFRILTESEGRDTPKLRKFFESYGPDESCAMCLLLCTQNFSKDGNTWRNDSNILFYALSALEMYGGTPQLERLPTSTVNSFNIPDYGYAVTVPQIKYSHKFYGISLFIARVLRPFWNQSVLMVTPTPKEKFYSCKFSRNQLHEIAFILSQLKDLLGEISSGTLTTYSNSSIRQGRRIDDTAIREEQQSLSCLHLLVKICLEACIFLDILCKQEFSVIVEKSPTDVQQELSTITFKEFVTTERGVICSRGLVSGLINHFTKEKKLVDPIMNELRKKCPLYFSEGSLSLFKGYEMLQSAKTTLDDDTRYQLLEKSLEIFLKAPESVEIKQICEDYSFLYFFRGVLQLALTYSKAVDQSEAGIAWYHAGKPEEDEFGKRKYFERKYCYDIIIEKVFDFLHQPSSDIPFDSMTWEKLTEGVCLSLSRSFEFN